MDSDLGVEFDFSVGFMPWVSIIGVTSKGGDKLIVISKERSVIGA